MKVLSALACASLLAVSMAAPAVAGVKVKNGNGGSVNVNRGGVKVQGGGGSQCEGEARQKRLGQHERPQRPWRQRQLVSRWPAELRPKHLQRCHG